MGGRASWLGDEGLHRFFVVPGKLLSLSPEDSYHARRVLRLGKGDRLIGVLPGGPEILCEVSHFDAGIVYLGRLQHRYPRVEPPVKVTLVQAMPKGPKMDLIVEKAVEMGASRIVPTLSRRSVSRPGEGSARKRVERWRRLAREAAALSGRLVVPEITDITGWEDALKEAAPNTFAIIPWEETRGPGLGEVLGKYEPRDMTLFIGPEGGFERGEVEMAKARGALEVSLGPRIMRVETAALAALALVLGLWGDLGSTRGTPDWRP